MTEQRTLLRIEAAVGVYGLILLRRKKVIYGSAVQFEFRRDVFLHDRLCFQLVGDRTKRLLRYGGRLQCHAVPIEVIFLDSRMQVVGLYADEGTRIVQPVPVGARYLHEQVGHVADRRITAAAIRYFGTGGIVSGAARTGFRSARYESEAAGQTDRMTRRDLVDQTQLVRDIVVTVLPPFVGDDAVGDSVQIIRFSDLVRFLLQKIVKHLIVEIELSDSDTERYADVRHAESVSANSRTDIRASEITAVGQPAQTDAQNRTARRHVLPALSVGQHFDLSDHFGRQPLQLFGIGQTIVDVYFRSHSAVHRVNIILNPYPGHEFQRFRQRPVFGERIADHRHRVVSRLSFDVFVDHLYGVDLRRSGRQYCIVLFAGGFRNREPQVEVFVGQMGETQEVFSRRHSIEAVKTGRIGNRAGDERRIRCVVQPHGAICNAGAFRVRNVSPYSEAIRPRSTRCCLCTPCKRKIREYRGRNE